MDCSGSSTEICGGPNRLSFYKTTSAGPLTVQIAGPFSYQGCYTEATNGRALSAKATAGSTMTVEQCSTFCTGYSMMGVEYGSECYCGNSLNTGSVSTTSGCSMTCSGDASEYCGGSNRLNLYSTGNSAKTSSSSTTTSTKAPAKTTTKAPAAATPTIVLGNANYTYSGCYTDSVAARSLPNEVIATDQMTVESCLQACSAYTYAGLEYAR